MNADPLLLLAGPSAVSLAPRLAASGYATLDWLVPGPRPMPLNRVNLQWPLCWRPIRPH